MSDFKHDWECAAIGEKGYYFWRCKRCGTSLPYPSPNEAFDAKGPCSGNATPLSSLHTCSLAPDAEASVRKMRERIETIDWKMIKAAEDDWKKQGRVGQYHGHIAEFVRAALAAPDAPPEKENGQ